MYLCLLSVFLGALSKIHMSTKATRVVGSASGGSARVVFGGVPKISRNVAEIQTVERERKGEKEACLIPPLEPQKAEPVEKSTTS